MQLSRREEKSKSLSNYDAIKQAFMSGYEAGRIASRVEVRTQFDYAYPFAVYKDGKKLYAFRDECLAIECAETIRNNIADYRQRQYDTCWCGGELIDGVCQLCGTRKHNN